MFLKYKCQRPEDAADADTEAAADTEDAADTEAAEDTAE